MRVSHPLPGLARLAGAALAAILLTTPVLADGPSRPATPAEQSYYNQVMAVLARSTPAAPPPGWEETSRTQIKTPAYVGEGIGEDPMGLEYHVRWQDLPRSQAAQQAQVAAGAEVMRRQMAQPSTATQERRVEALAAQLGQAVERGDMATVNRLQGEMDQLYDEINRVQGQRDAELQAALKRHQVKDVDAGVSLLVNSAVVEFIGRVAKDQPVAGLTVYRQEGEDNPHLGWREGYSWVFLGAGWKLMREGDHQYMEFSPKAGVPHTTVQNLVVRVQAAPERARALLAALDWAALKGLIK